MENAFKEKRDLIFAFKELRLQGMETEEEPVKEVPEGLFIKCKYCGESYTKDELQDNLYLCPHCSHHEPISAYKRLEIVLDKDSFKEINKDMHSNDPLNFPGYQEKLQKQEEKCGIKEALVTGTGTIDGIKTAIGVMDSRFLMASMSAALGEKLTLLIELAEKEHLPLIIFTASGGARMQEGIFSLMQMVKTAQAIKRFGDNGGLYIAYLTHPTTGGVSASFATLGDITLAEPDALIGFAGQRVIEQTIGQKLPQGFQRAEYLQEHGFVDHIVSRQEMKKTLSLLLRLHQKGEQK